MDGKNIINEEIINQNEQNESEIKIESEDNLSNFEVDKYDENENEKYNQKEKKAKRHTVGFEPTNIDSVYLVGTNIAYDKDGNFYGSAEEIDEALKKDGVMLFVFDMNTGLPYAYENRNGSLFVSSEPISATAQLPGSNFEPKKSALPEDIAEGADAFDIGKKNREITNNIEFVKGQDILNKKYSEGFNDVRKKISDLEKEIKALPEEPKAPDESKMHKKPEYVPNKPKLPVKPQPPIAPVKPKAPKKPDMPQPPFEIKNLMHYKHPGNAPERKDYIQEIGQPPKYSKIGQFFSRIFRRTDSDDYKEFVKYQGKRIENEENIKKFKADLAKYKKQLKTYNDREEEIKQYNEFLEQNKEKYDEYNLKVEEYKSALEKYKAEEEQYKKEDAEYQKKAETFKKELDLYSKTSFQDYLKQMDQYEKDAKAESQRSKKYDADLVLYESDVKRLEKENEKYKIRKEQYEKENETFLKKYGSLENAKKELVLLKQREADLKENLRREEDRLANATEIVKENNTEIKKEKEKGKDNLKKINEYRAHTEVILEGISNMIQKGKVTRENLFANKWVLKNACKGKTLQSEEGLDNLYKYLANMKAERKILSNTDKYMISNPHAEVAAIVSLNDDSFYRELKNDRKLNEILKEWGQKPIDPDEISNRYFATDMRIQKKYGRMVQKTVFTDLKKYLENDHGRKEIGEEAFENFLRYETLRKFEYFKSTNEKPATNSELTCLEDYIFGKPTNKDFEKEFEKNMNSFRETYKEAFNELLRIKNEKDNALKDLPESARIAMNMLSVYKLSEFGQALKDTQERLIKEGKIDRDGKVLPQKEEQKEIKPKEIKPKGKGF